MVHEDQRCWGPAGAGGRRDSQRTPLGTEMHPALRLLVCLQCKPQLHHPPQKVPNSAVLQVPSQSNVVLQTSRRSPQMQKPAPPFGPHGGVRWAGLNPIHPKYAGRSEEHPAAPWCPQRSSVTRRRLTSRGGCQAEPKVTR